jgi:hypothetical protein
LRDWNLNLFRHIEQNKTFYKEKFKVVHIDCVDILNRRVSVRGPRLVSLESV